MCHVVLANGISGILLSERFAWHCASRLVNINVTFRSSCSEQKKSIIYVLKLVVAMGLLTGNVLHEFGSLRHKSMN